jgi:hypothetical protein
MEFGDPMRRSVMYLWAFVSILLTGGSMLHAQQALMANGGKAVVFKGSSVTEVSVHYSLDEKTFRLGGRVYPEGGAEYFQMVENNKKKFDVLTRVQTKDGRIWFDNAPVEVGHQIESVRQALQWGDSIACIGIIPVATKAWSSNKAYALIVFSSKTRKGGYKELGHTGKVEPNLILIDPIESVE